MTKTKATTTLAEVVRLKQTADKLHVDGGDEYRAARQEFLNAQAAWWEAETKKAPLSFLDARGRLKAAEADAIDDMEQLSPVGPQFPDGHVVVMHTTIAGKGHVGRLAEEVTEG
jgi:hypothetical protein